MLNRSKLDRWCDAVLEAGWLAAVVVAPLFFNVFSSRVFEPDKISLVRTIALTMLVAWLIKVANGGFAWLPPGKDAPGPDGQAPQDYATGQNWRGFWRNPFFIPVALLIVAYALSTVFSVAGFVSWFGSYQRLQGTYSFLAYVTIGGLTAATLRHPAQVRRLQHAIIITGLACSIYGVVQHYRLDPLPWGGDVTTRVAGNAGNSIFLGAMLIIAFFVTLERVFNSFVRLIGIGQPAGADTQDWQTSLAGGAYLFVLLVTSVAIVWTQSRGPWLGWLAGIYLFALLTLSAVRPRYYRPLIVTLFAVGVGLAGFIVALNTVPALEPVRELPYVGRLTSILDLDEGTNKVRTLIWSGAANLALPHDALTFPDGEQDTINVLRPLVGYGPEAMWIAYNRFYPPALANVEARNASPDRSHNETWDSLVITGVFGFLAYTAVFLSIFYWALRWVGLIRTRRDNILFAVLLTITTVLSIVGFLAFDNWQLRLFGVAWPFGIIAGYALYVTAAAFRNSERPDRNELPRQMLIIALLTAVVAHYMEIHFAIAIGATRTMFWVLAATLMVIGMRLALPQPAELAEVPVTPEPVEPAPAGAAGKGKGKGKGGPAPVTRRRVPTTSAPLLPLTILTDVLVFLTFVYIYTTNARGSRDTLDVLFSSIFQRPGQEMTFSPAIFFLLLFTWLVAATIGLAAESLNHRKAPGASWWLRGYGLHFAIVWGAWFFYGLLQAWRLVPFAAAAGMTNQQYLDQQLERVAGHFGLFTFLIVAWMLVSGTIFAWRWLRERDLPAAGRVLPAAATATFATVLAIFLVFTVNVNLVKADIVYKQGQQFDNQGNWVNSIELYRRALATRKTEDQYMLFLGRALLEQAKQAGDTGAYKLPDTPGINDVLALNPDEVMQMSRGELLRAAEVVLTEAQTVNPLNTDHTANLARLYRTWGDLVANDATQRQAMLEKSIAMYDKAVMLSPNAAHLWNERGNAFAADNRNDDALASYEQSLSIDQQYDQTYLLMADLLQRTNQNDKLKPLLDQGIAVFEKLNMQDAAAQLLSYLSVVQARQGDTAAAIATNQQLLTMMPGNVTALRNLAILARDQGKPAEALEWLNQGIAAAGQNAGELKPFFQLGAEIYQAQGNVAETIAMYERIRQVDPADVAALTALAQLYAGQANDAKLIEVSEQLMQADPTNYLHPLTVAQALMRQNQAQQALSYAQQALQLAPDDQKPVIQQLVTQLGG